MTSDHLLQAPHWRVQQWTIDLTRPALGLVGGALVGLIIFGGGSRLAMRLVALIAGMTPTATLSGTLGLLLMGAVLGALLGLLYAAVQRWLPVAWPIKGLLFGVIFAALTIWPFTQGLDGEAALAAPWIGATLFGLLPLIFCPALAYTLHRLERPLVARTPRPVGLFWFLAFVGSLGFAFVSMLALGETIRIPQLVSQGLAGTGVAFHAMRELLGLSGALTGLLFCLLHMLVLWVGFDRPALKTASIVQLLLAGLLIRNTPWLPFLVGTNAGAWGEWVAWLGLALLILITMLWTGRQPAWRTAFISMSSFGLVFLLLWLAILLTPAMQLRGISGVQTAVTVAPYLIIWLLLPLRLSWMGCLLPRKDTLSLAPPR